MLRTSAPALVRHRTPRTEAFRTGILRPRVQVRQTEHVTELVAVGADGTHRVSAGRANEVGPRFALEVHSRAMRPVKAAAIGGWVAVPGVNEQQAVESAQGVLAVARLQEL